MTWFRVDDDLADHPKIGELLDGKLAEASISLWVLAGSWCAKHLTDGHIPASRPQRFGLKKYAEAAAELVRVGLWVVTDDGWKFHDWHKYQPSRDDVTAERAAWADRQRRSRGHRSHAGVTRDATTTSRVTHAGVTESHPSPAHPSPSQPIPTQLASDPGYSTPTTDMSAALVIDRAGWAGLSRKCSTTNHDLLRKLEPVSKLEYDRALESTKTKGGNSVGFLVGELAELRRNPPPPAPPPAEEIDFDALGPPEYLDVLRKRTKP